MASSATPYKNQNYSELKQQCKEARKLFEDPEFPASNASLFYQKPPPGIVEWKRPKEISDDPHLFVEGVSRQDLNQGELGNCWFVAACSCLALRPKLWKRVIPNWKEQEWDPDHPENYAGIFHFRFWIFGQWVDVVVDDRLPTIRGNLLYCHSKQRNEFWSALLEKAYAKLSGCYESLDGGNAGDAVVDFSGAVAESINLNYVNDGSNPQKQAKLFEYLLKVNDGGGMISCSIKASPSEFQARMSCGLVKGHAYSVTAVRKMHLERVKDLSMIRMRNPWGTTEWNGPWSDSSKEWQRVAGSERKSMGITVDDDGEFWMVFEDWCRYFTEAVVCRLINTSPQGAGKTLHEAMNFGSWTEHPVPLLNRCGGCMNNRDTFLQNPQYMFEIKKQEEEVLISLQQRDMKIHRPIQGGENLTIGFVIFKVELNRKYRMHDILTQEAVDTTTYINARTVFMRKILGIGTYIIIPSTFTPRVLGDFMLRLFTDLDSSCRELTSDKPRVNCWSKFQGYPCAVTQIHIKGAHGLKNQGQSGGVNPYVIISCEGTSVQSTVQENTLEPLFDTRAIFYRKKPRKPITIEVWSSVISRDQFMGQVVLAATAKGTTELQTLPLHKRGTPDHMPGTITLRVFTSVQLTEM